MSKNTLKLTIPELALKKVAGERPAMVAVGDTLSAMWAERAGIDILCVGASLGITLYGHENTLPITVDQMIKHTRVVRREAANTFTLVSMPYGSYATKDLAAANAVRMIKESGAEAFKQQGGGDV